MWMCLDLACLKLSDNLILIFLSTAWACKTGPPAVCSTSGAEENRRGTTSWGGEETRGGETFGARAVGQREEGGRGYWDEEKGVYVVGGRCVCVWVRCVCVCGWVRRKVCVCGAGWWVGKLELYMLHALIIHRVYWWFSLPQLEEESKQRKLQEEARLKAEEVERQAAIQKIRELVRTVMYMYAHIEEYLYPLCNYHT